VVAATLKTGTGRGSEKETGRNNNGVRGTEREANCGHWALTDHGAFERCTGATTARKKGEKKKP